MNAKKTDGKTRGDDRPLTRDELVRTLRAAVKRQSRVFNHTGNLWELIDDVADRLERGGKGESP